MIFLLQNLAVFRIVYIYLHVFRQEGIYLDVLDMKVYIQNLDRIQTEFRQNLDRVQTEFRQSLDRFRQNLD